MQPILSFKSPTSWVVLLLLLPASAESTSSQRYSAKSAVVARNARKHHSPRKQQPKNNNILLLRGGSSKPSSSASSSTTEKYRMEQILLLQSRSARLREALVDRGLLQDYAASDGPNTPQPVDWDCALSTPKSPKSCLYSFDAELYTKVVAPIDTNEWITLGSLNRLRRTDPSKIEPLWHSKYAIFDSWFRAGKSPYSMYAHLPWQGYMLSLLLDVPLVLDCALASALAVVFRLTRPIWESMITVLLTSQFLWTRYINWARFVHAALPLKLFFGQMAWKGITIVFSKIQGIAREYLIQVESRIWEEAMPLTIGEGLESKVNVDAEVDEFAVEDAVFDGEGSDSDSD